MFHNIFIVFLSYEDSNFSWANAGATVFGSAVASAPKNNGNEEGSDEEDAPNNVDIHFEPIVSLPEVPPFFLNVHVLDVKMMFGD